MHRLWDSVLIAWNTGSEDIWFAELAGLDTDQNRAAWMGGASTIGRRNRCWRPVRPIWCPGRMRGSSPARSYPANTTTPICRSCGAGSIRGVCGWRWCSMRRGPPTDRASGRETPRVDTPGLKPIHRPDPASPRGEHDEVFEADKARDGRLMVQPLRRLSWWGGHSIVELKTGSLAKHFGKPVDLCGGSPTGSRIGCDRGGKPSRMARERF
jgi:hypothetical protein